MKKLIYNQVLSKTQIVGKVNCAAMQFVCYFLTAILLALFMPASLASYTYNPSLQTYTECGSGYYESFAMSYSNVNAEPPYAELHVRWCERTENKSRRKLLCFLPTPSRERLIESMRWLKACYLKGFRGNSSPMYR